MSADTEGDQRPESEAIVEPLHRWYHVLVLAVVLAYMLWTRTRAYGEFVRDGQVFFRGNDAYYHYRATMYSVKNWPSRIYAEPWTNFPTGQHVGQFGTLMDQVVATVALVVGLGDPSSRQVATVTLLAPAVFGALVAIPAYYLAKQLSESRAGGVTAAVLIALIPQSSWVSRTTVGFYDHHVAEALTMTIAVFAMVYAIAVARRERPVFEQVQDRDWSGLRPTAKTSALAGVALGAYLLTWAAGVILVGIFGVFFVLAMSVAVLREESPEHLAFAGAISHVVALLAVLPWVETFGVETTSLSLLQVLLLFGVAAGCFVLGAMARYWDDDSLAPSSYPIAVAGLGVVAVVVLWLVLPEAIANIRNNLQRILLLGQTDTTLTISEAQAMDTSSLGALGEQFYGGYGYTFFVALAAVAWMGGRGLLAERTRSEYLLVTVWTIFLLLMAITQVRFHYYLVIPVAVLNGWLVVQVLNIANFPPLPEFEDVQAYHVLTVFAILMLLVVPIASPIAVATSADRAEQTGPSSVIYWQDNLDWMAENTPEPGEYGGADNGMSYYGPFENVGSDYEYPEGAYGVMSWWDYGHWITVEGERIPYANPFQAGATGASAYLQETNETRANMYLEALPADSVAGGELYGMSNESLREAIDGRTEQEAGEETRYVMIDDQMAGGKFSAIAEWTGPGSDAYIGTQQARFGNDTVSLQGLNDRYYRTMLSRLYYNDASRSADGEVGALSHYRLVHESPTPSAVLSIAQPTQNGIRSTGIIGYDLGMLQQYYPSVYSSIRTGDGSFAAYDDHSEAAVKTYERVEGATITGEAEPNRTVQAVVTMETNTGRQFNYVQSTTVGEDGTFGLTVPYSTTDELGPEDGYTDAAVVANGTYTVRGGQQIEINGQGQFATVSIAQNVSVPESAIYDGDSIDVELESVGDGNQSSSSNASGSAPEGSSTSASSVSGSAGAHAGSQAAAASAGSTTAFGAVASSVTALGGELAAAVHTVQSIAAARIAG